MATKGIRKFALFMVCQSLDRAVPGIRQPDHRAALFAVIYRLLYP
jgi:hypothetical protein